MKTLNYNNALAAVSELLGALSVYYAQNIEPKRVKGAIDFKASRAVYLVKLWIASLGTNDRAPSVSSDNALVIVDFTKELQVSALRFVRGEGDYKELYNAVDRLNERLKLVLWS